MHQFVKQKGQKGFTESKQEIDKGEGCCRIVASCPPLSPQVTDLQSLTQLTRPTRTDTWTDSPPASGTCHADAASDTAGPPSSHWSNSSARLVSIHRSKVQASPSHVTCFLCSCHPSFCLCLALASYCFDTADFAVVYSRPSLTVLSQSCPWTWCQTNNSTKRRRRK